MTAREIDLLVLVILTACAIGVVVYWAVLFVFHKPAWEKKLDAMRAAKAAKSTPAAAAAGASGAEAMGASSA